VVNYERIAAVFVSARRPSRGPDGSVVLFSPTDERAWERELQDAVRSRFASGVRRDPDLRGTIHCALSRPSPVHADPLRPPTFDAGPLHAIVAPFQAIVAECGAPSNVSADDSFWTVAPGAALRLGSCLIVRPDDGSVEDGQICKRFGADVVFRKEFARGTAGAALLGSDLDFGLRVVALLQISGMHPQQARAAVESAALGEEVTAQPPAGAASAQQLVEAACVKVALRTAVAEACAAAGCWFREASGRLWEGIEPGEALRDVARLASRLGSHARPYAMTPQGRVEEALRGGWDPSLLPGGLLDAADAATRQHVAAVVASEAFKRHKALSEIEGTIADVVSGRALAEAFASKGLDPMLACDYMAALIRREVLDRGGEWLAAAVAERHILALPVSAFAAQPDVLRALATLPVQEVSLAYRRTRRVQEQLRRDLHASEGTFGYKLAQAVREAHDNLELGRRAAGADLIRRDPAMAIEIGADRRELISERAAELPALVRECGPRPVGVKSDKPVRSDAKGEKALAALGRLWEKGGIAREIVSQPRQQMPKTGGGTIGNED